MWVRYTYLATSKSTVHEYLSVACLLCLKSEEDSRTFRARKPGGSAPNAGTRVFLLIAVAALAALALAGCERLFPDVEDWIVDSEKLARRFDACLGDLKECVEEDNCDEALDTERGAFAMCSWVTSRGELAPEGFEAAEWERFDALCEGLEGVLGLPKADALGRI